GQTAHFRLVAHSALGVGKFLHKVLPEYHSDITRQLISSVLFSFVYSALRSASHRHKPFRIRTSGHSPRFDRSHAQPPSRNPFIIRTSGIRFCNPFVIRTCEKRGGETRHQATHSINPYPALFCTLVFSNSRAISGLSALCPETPGVGGTHRQPKVR